MKPLVSIVIPCHNAAPWLAEAIDSALAQSWPQKEIIVVDDGSADDSVTLANSYAAHGVRVAVQPNAGASAARNHGLRLAKGDFIQFLDADDLLSPEKLAAQMEVLDRGAARGIASCAWGRFAGTPAQAQFVNPEVCRDFEAVEFMILSSNTGAMMHPAAWLAHRSVIEAAGPWDETLTVNDDGEFFCRVLLAAGGSRHSDGCCTYYRSGNSQSLSHRRDEAGRRSHFRSIERIESSLRAAEDSPRVRSAMANSYMRFIFDYYPWPRDLMRSAEEAILRLGGSSLRDPEMGSRTARLARFIGWKGTWRLKSWLGLR